MPRPFTLLKQTAIIDLHVPEIRSQVDQEYGTEYHYSLPDNPSFSPLWPFPNPRGTSHLSGLSSVLQNCFSAVHPSWYPIPCLSLDPWLEKECSSSCSAKPRVDHSSGEALAFSAFSGDWHSISLPQQIVGRPSTHSRANGSRISFHAPWGWFWDRPVSPHFRYHRFCCFLPFRSLDV